ncbi:hypothetical protein L1987_59625 [Smallanthus sonchifolius]|uniref:Uncharacterized protein n=1 Tax=Smallanthus sonchifolius TaxID=185202 RepID=A0ACB9D605_9ASTR|nr:hypothetical protein L1987_59625 [Smallanthus sonchifolius]
MAYLKNFKKLLAAKKVLRLFTTKLRLHKLQRSKTTVGKSRNVPPVPPPKVAVVGSPYLVEIIRENTVEGTSNKGGGPGGGVTDDMWESLVMGSSQMDGINERAEEFISRFRADLLVQEIMDRRL